MSINANVLGLCEVDGFCPWKLFNLNENSFVVDLGAHVGDFSKYILQTYGCWVDAYEPSNINNLEYPKYRLFRKAVLDGTKMTFPEGQGTGGNLFTGSGPEIDTIDIRDITKVHIDLMKVNIEGSEIIVLGLANLDNVDQLLVEFHLFRVPVGDYELVKSEIEQVVKRIMGFGYQMKQINDAPAYMFYGKS